MIYDLVVIGGGPAGMMAAISAAQTNQNICLLERNSSLGKKLLLTGKGRCNFTSNKSIPQIVDVFGKKGKFFYGALSRFSNRDLINFFKKHGVESVVERGERVFPKSNRANTILECLINELNKLKLKVIYNFRAIKLEKKEDIFFINSNHDQSINCRKVVICTGGLSYPATGSTGDGYEMAKKLGHTITPLIPALAALIVKDVDIRSLAGLSLKNVRLYFYAEDIEVINLFGEMLFTHAGISGPIVLQASKLIGQELSKHNKVVAKIDFKPALDVKTLTQRINKDILAMAKKEYQGLLAGLLPKKIIPLFFKLTNIDEHRKNGSLTKEEKNKLIVKLKDFKFKIDGIAPIETAIITSGGVDVNEINSTSMESKIVPGLYFAGEIIGLEAPTGGYNLQKAFSTGWVAGNAAIDNSSSDVG